jgi:hypothetical protein
MLDLHVRYCCCHLCQQHGHPGSLWASATSGQQPLLDALDVLIKRASWRDSIVALLMWPALWGLRHLGAWWLWIWATQSLGARWGLGVGPTVFRGDFVLDSVGRCGVMNAAPSSAVSVKWC